MNNPATENTRPAAAPPESSPRFRYWQTRTLIAAMLGYIAFYFVRKNLSIAMPFIEKDAALGITKSDLGIFLTLHGVLYGISKFANGILGDRANARVFMITGLVLSAATNVIFGFGASALVLGVVWMANGWFQGMGFPPCARLMTHWFPPEKLATKMSVWNTSHSIGAGLVVIGCGCIVGFGWRWCFFAPAALVLLLAVALWFAMRDTPSSVGLPEIKVAGAKDGGETLTMRQFMYFLRNNVFTNRYIWIIAIANFFVYTVRFSVLDWGPTLLTQAKHMPITHASLLVAGFEIAGVVGMLAAGWLTDRVLGGRGARMCMICMIGATVSIVLFWRLAAPPMWLAAGVLGAAGFFIYGPQALVGIAVANLATKRAAATAVGFTGLFGYLSTILSGWGLGRLVELHGWDAALGALAVISLVGVFMFVLAWPAKAHGYGAENKSIYKPMNKHNI